MNDGGYTLPDTLAALAIISLAMAGVLSGTVLLARVQARTDLEVARATGLRRASVALQDLLADAGPFRSNDAAFSGAPTLFDFPCGTGRCGARLDGSPKGLMLSIRRLSGVDETILLRGVSSSRFSYVSGRDVGATWPRISARPERLRQLMIIEDSNERPVAQALLPIDQPVNCEFDVVSQDCR